MDDLTLVSGYDLDGVVQLLSDKGFHPHVIQSRYPTNQSYLWRSEVLVEEPFKELMDKVDEHNQTSWMRPQRMLDTSKRKNNKFVQFSTKNCYFHPEFEGSPDFYLDSPVRLRNGNPLAQTVVIGRPDIRIDGPVPAEFVDFINSFEGWKQAYAIISRDGYDTYGSDVFRTKPPYLRSTTVRKRNRALKLAGTQ